MLAEAMSSGSSAGTSAAHAQQRPTAKMTRSVVPGRAIQTATARVESSVRTRMPAII